MNTPSQPDLICYKQMPVWDTTSLPTGLQGRHNTKAGTWGQLRVLRGQLKFYWLDEADNTLSTHILTPESPVWTIPPQAWHKVEPMGSDLQMQLEFHCDKADYFNKKYGLTTTHSAVVQASARLSPGRALDLGCGQGRNALYLALKGFDVTASDHNAGPLQGLLQLAGQEGLPLRAAAYDMNHAALAELAGALGISNQWDLLVATVVFMFLQPDRVPAILADMQAHTSPGGCNLIVSAMDTADFPCTMPFSFTFKEGELRRHYEDKGWQLLNYREEPGQMHATDAQGQPIRLKFVTMLARKPD